VASCFLHQLTSGSQLCLSLKKKYQRKMVINVKSPLRTLWIFGVFFLATIDPIEGQRVRYSEIDQVQSLISSI